MAGRRLGVPVVVTVRDHWPWDYFATGLHGDRLPFEHQTWASLAADLPMRLGPLRGALALPAIPYLLAHLRRRQQFLRQADAVIAVSDYIARRLVGVVAPERLHVIPNMVDLPAIDSVTSSPPTSVSPGTPYLLYVGKLDRNKGAHLLIDIFREMRSSNLQLVVAGSELAARRARARAGGLGRAGALPRLDRPRRDAAADGALPNAAVPLGLGRAAEPRDA